MKSLCLLPLPCLMALASCVAMKNRHGDTVVSVGGKMAYEQTGETTRLVTDHDAAFGVLGGVVSDGLMWSAMKPLIRGAAEATVKATKDPNLIPKDPNVIPVDPNVIPVDPNLVQP